MRTANIINILKRTVLLAAGIISLVLALPACNSDSIPGNESSGYATMRLNVSVAGHSGNIRSEAPGTPTRSYGFEGASSPYENMRTLRIIIVRPDGTVEHNRFLEFQSDLDGIGPLEFKVADKETKNVFLFANEKSMGYDFSSIVEFSRFPFAKLRDFQLTRQNPGTPLYGDGDYIPMSEEFSIFVRGDESGQTPVENLFLTRAAVKFSFRISKSSDYKGTGLKVNSIDISGIADKEYLLPNGTEYSPSKYPLTEKIDKRAITAYRCPANTTTAIYSYNLPYPLAVEDLAAPFIWAPPVYLPESPVSADGYTCRLTFADRSFSSASVPLPNLPSLPRNTHVVIDITIGNDRSLILDVEALPWDTESNEFDYSNQVGLNQNGSLSFKEDSYASLNKQTARLVLNNYPRVAEGTFGIASPKGARWDAYLISDPYGAIQFVTGSENGVNTYSDHISGEVGTTAVFRIGATATAGSDIRTATMRVIVTTPDGTTMTANVLQGGGYGTNEYITIIQNPQ